MAGGAEAVDPTELDDDGQRLGRGLGQGLLCRTAGRVETPAAQVGGHVGVRRTQWGAHVGGKLAAAHWWTVKIGKGEKLLTFIINIVQICTRKNTYIL